MSETMRRLREDHVHIARLLDLMEQQVGRLHECSLTDYELMRDLMRYMAEYPDVFHHPTEDVVFRRLVEVHPAAAPMVDELLREHRVLAEKGEHVRNALRSVVDGALVPRDILEEQCRDYIATLRRHRDREEELLFPLADEHLAPRDWEEIERTLSAGEDPLFGPVVAEQFRSLYDFILQQSD